MMFRLVRIFTTLVALLLAGISSASPELPSVVDLYLDIPQEFFTLVSEMDGKPLTIEQRKSLMDQSDQKKGISH